MARRKKKKGKKDGMMKKVAGKNFETYRGTETLLKSGEATGTSVKANNADLYNRADNTLKQLTGNTGIPRQKVRMK